MDSYGRSGKKYSATDFPEVIQVADQLLDHGLSHVLLHARPAWTGPAEVAMFLRRYRHGRTLDPNFAIVEAPGMTSGLRTVMIINKAAARKKIANEPDAFKLVANPTPEAVEAVLEWICQPENFLEIANDDVMLGSLLDFGADNSRKYVEYVRAVDAEMRSLVQSGSIDPDDDDEIDDAYKFVGERLARSMGTEEATASLKKIHQDMSGSDQVRPYLARYWDSAKTVQDMSRNINGAFDINERIDAAHASALELDPDARRLDSHIDLALGALYP